MIGSKVEIYTLNVFCFFCKCVHFQWVLSVTVIFLPVSYEKYKEVLTWSSVFQEDIDKLQPTHTDFISKSFDEEGSSKKCENLNS